MTCVHNFTVDWAYDKNRQISNFNIFWKGIKMKKPMFKFFFILASLSIGFLHNGRCHGFRKPIHGPFHSLICGHSKVIFHMTFFTHHRKNIINHKPPLIFFFLCHLKKVHNVKHSPNFHVLAILVLIEAWRINILIRMELGEPPREDDYVHNLQ